jgi:glucose-1-phosphate adenylyltransferase
LISEGCILNAKEINHSVIGIRSRIGDGTIIKNSYIMKRFLSEYRRYEFRQNNKILIGIGENCFISNTIVDKKLQIEMMFISMVENI